MAQQQASGQNTTMPTRTELVWPGKRTQVERVALPFQVVETVNQSRAHQPTLNAASANRAPEGWTNKLIWGENKYVMASLLQGDPSIGLEPLAGKIDLIYIDPPFATGQDFSYRVRVGDEEWVKEASAIEEKAYRDTWGRGLDSYLQTMYERLVLMRDLLSETGSIYVHCDWRVNLYLGQLLRELFAGWESTEIIWVCGLMGHGSFYPKAHETIFCYRSPLATFNPPPRLRLSTRITGALQGDSEGWFYTRGRESSGGSNWLRTYISKNPNISKEQAIQEANKERLQPAWSVWMGKKDLAEAFNDFPSGTYAFTPQENLGYSTQKPEALMQRIIKASSDEGDLVAVSLFTLLTQVLFTEMDHPQHPRASSYMVLPSSDNCPWPNLV